MKFGLRDQDLTTIIREIERYDSIEKAILFGSRAKGTYLPGSDVDIALVGERVDFDVASRLHARLEEESPMPYFFDIVDYTHLADSDLKAHIDRVGEVIFERPKPEKQGSVR